MDKNKPKKKKRKSKEDLVEGKYSAEIALAGIDIDKSSGLFRQKNVQMISEVFHLNSCTFDGLPGRSHHSHSFGFDWWTAVSYADQIEHFRQFKPIKTGGDGTTYGGQFE